ncbi:3116_t:CDS:2 [Gigaspora margarita]|uniref:3116_t:CDS:1 n=1 Tax=Gigaspora margarita TaxID=4874 RepID=A0ABN7VS88_GIGMA|nr:3116_t:CDS:2 [Gigaspora margarita]
MVDQDNLLRCNLEHTVLFEVESDVDVESDDVRNIESDANGDAKSDIERDVERDTERDAARLFTGKVFENWEQWFTVVKDRVYREEGIVRRRTYICQHGRNYGSTSKKKTSTKKISCPWHVNASCPKVKNPNSTIFINTIVDEHNHQLSVDAIAFECVKRFSEEMLEDIKFLTQHCKMGATAQKKYLEGKYPLQPIFSKDLYRAIQKYRPTAKSLSNDAAQMSNWLDMQKEKDTRWVVARGWDDDNALTHLLWMKPEQVENWIKFSDSVINDVTHKTNWYGMALSLFVGFDRNRQNILLAQGLLADENYPKGKSYLEFHYKSKEHWAHSYTSFKFTAGMISTSRVEAMNACLKRLLYNSNVSLCDLMFEIHRLLDQQNKQNQYQYWKLAIPSLRNLEHALGSNDHDATFSNDENKNVDDPQATIHQLLDVVGSGNVNELWEDKDVSDMPFIVAD